MEDGPAAFMDLAEQIERISEDLVFTEPDDTEALKDLHKRFKSISDNPAVAACPKAMDAASTTVDLLYRAIAGEAPCSEEALEFAAGTLTALQSIFRDERNAEEVDFPKTKAGISSQPNPDDDPAEIGSSPSGAEQIPHPPAHVNESIFSDFLARQDSVLQEIEGLVVSLESSPDDEKLGHLRRIIHTIKGEAGLLALSDVERLCHATEDMLNQQGSSKSTDLLLEVKDWLGRAFDFYAGKGSAPKTSTDLLRRIELKGREPDSVRPGDESVPEAGLDESGFNEPKTLGEAPTTPPSETTEPINEPLNFANDPELLQEFVGESAEHLSASDQHLLTLETNPRDDEALNAVFRAFHTIKGVASFCELDEIRELAHKSENMLDLARKGEILMEGRAIDAAFDAVDGLKRMLEAVNAFLKSGTPITKDKGLPALLSKIQAAGAKSKQEAEHLKPTPTPTPKEDESQANVQVENVAAEDPQAQTQTTPERAVPSPAPSIALVPRKPQPLPTPSIEQNESTAPDSPNDSRPNAAQKAIKVAEQVKVDTDRLDRFVDTIGELVIAESMVAQSVLSRNADPTDLNRHMTHLGKITRSLQEMAMSLRMVPIRAVFQKMARLVRDVAKKADKNVNFSMSGEDTELDKTVVDQIGDPLVHMVRNAVDHGLEPNKEERRKAGKSDIGNVYLRAFHKGGNIHVEIEDDGRGLNRERILRKAIERKLISENANLSDRDIWNLVFEPGFSTAEKVTDVSGRGVGMDVVRKNIERLRGTVEITSTEGKGSIFSLRLPLTLAIIDGMVVRLADERYIIPTLSVVCTIRPRAEDLSTALQRGEMLKLQGHLVPLFRLSDLFSVEHSVQRTTDALIVVVEAEGRRVGFQVDELLGQQQIVIKSLGESMRGLPGISGGAVMPDGRVGLILDISGLVKLTQSGSVMRECLAQAGD